MTGKLKPTLGTLHLWGIAVGLVISGEYFGWSYGWGVAGTLGFLITTALIATLYTCFIFSFYRTDHGDSARWRAVRLQPSGIWRNRWSDCRSGDAD